VHRFWHLSMTEIAWNDDVLFWESLDSFVAIAWLPFNELIDVLHEHQSEMDEPTKAILFAGMGGFMRVYARQRQEGQDPLVAFNAAMNTVHHDRRVQAVFGAAANQVVDNAVQNLKGDA